MNFILNYLKYKSAFKSFVFFALLAFSFSAYSQKVDDLTDAQVKEFVRRAEASGMTENDIEKYAISRGYSASEILKLRERIAQMKSPQTKTSTKAELNEEGRLVTDPDNDKTKSEKNEKKEGSDEKKGDNNEKDKDKEKGDEKDKDEETAEEEFIFGSHLFNGKNLTFEPNLRLATPQNYILGTDDELLIDIFGNSQMNYKVKISPEGTVKIENLAPIVVNGLTINQASERIINRMKSIYYGLNSQGGGVYAQITLGSIRSIKVTIIGEVTKPGSYTVPSLATLFNVLYQAGGPSKYGSYRNISVIRDNKVIRTMDLYDFLLRADQKDNILMRDQDVVRIADYDKRIQIKGEIRRPAIFEVIKGETLKTALGFAGNFTDKAYKKSIKLTRVSDKEYKLLTVNEEAIEAFVPAGGDVFLVDTLSNTFENRIRIAGSVYRPGDFALEEKNIKTVKQLIHAAGGIQDDAFLNRATIAREGQFKELKIVSFDLGKLLNNEIDDIPLQKEDSVHINSVSDLHEKYYVTVYGEVNNPAEYNFKQNMTVADLIIESGGFTDGGSASRIELSRRIRKDTTGTSSWQNVKIFEFNIDENLQLAADDSKYILQPFDIISVKASPRYEVQQNVKIVGEVLFPGQYIVKDRTERLADIIKRSGGLRPSAFVKGATISRKDQIISIDFQNAIENENSLDNILLIKGDSINIPRKSETVNILGGVFNPAIVTFRDGTKVQEYISQSGGFEENALTKKVYVTYPNGISAKTKSFWFFRSYPKVEPGSTINVPTINKEDVQKLSAVEKSSIITAFVSMTGILFTIIKSLTSP
ncbi:MAG: SLBB domain-containing protein [Bacteroidota bacterium]